MLWRSIRLSWWKSRGRGFFDNENINELGEEEEEDEEDDNFVGVATTAWGQVRITYKCAAPHVEGDYIQLREMIGSRFRQNFRRQIFNNFPFLYTLEGENNI